MGWGEPSSCSTRRSQGSTLAHMPSLHLGGGSAQVPALGFLWDAQEVTLHYSLKQGWKAWEETFSHWGNKADDLHSTRKGTQRREQRNQVRESRDGSKRNQEWSMKALEGGMNQNHNTCDHGNVIFICSETLFSKELLVHKRDGGGNKVNYIS